MGNPLQGVGGAVKNGANALANVDTWDVTSQAATEKTTSFGATGSWETNAATIKSWTGKCSGRIDPSDTLGQVVWLNGLGTTVTVAFYMDSTKNWSGSAIITGINPKVNASNLEAIDFTLLGTGPLTVVLV